MTCKYCEKYKAKYPPKSHCEICWIKYFTVNVLRYEADRIAYETFGEKVIRVVKGDKYLKHFKEYMVKKNGS